MGPCLGVFFIASGIIIFTDSTRAQAPDENKLTLDDIREPPTTSTAEYRTPCAEIAKTYPEPQQSAALQCCHAYSPIIYGTTTTGKTLDVLRQPIEVPQAEEETIPLAEQPTQLQMGAIRQFVSTDTASELQKEIEEIIECCVNGLIPTEQTTRVDYETLRKRCGCANPMASAENVDQCFPCLATEHLRNFQHCHPEIGLEIGQEKAFVKTCETMKYISAYELPAEREAIIEDQTMQECLKKGGEYDQNSGECCYTRSINICSCDNPDYDPQSISLACTDKEKYFLYDYIRCLTDEIYDHWVNNLNLKNVRQEGDTYILTIKLPEDECDYVKMFNFSRRTNIRQKYIDCEITFRTCQCIEEEPVEEVPTETPPPPPPTSTPPAPTPLIPEEPTQPIAMELCVAFAGGPEALCEKAGVVYTDSDILEDYQQNAAVFPSEFGHQKNYESHMYFWKEIWQPFERDEISLTEAQERIRKAKDRLLLLKSFAKGETGMWAPKLVTIPKMKTMALTTPEAETVEGVIHDISPEMINFWTDSKTGQTQFYVTPPSPHMDKLTGKPTFGSILHLQITQSYEDSYVIYPVAIVGLQGTGGCSYITE